MLINRELRFMKWLLMMCIGTIVLAGWIVRDASAAQARLTVQEIRDEFVTVQASYLAGQQKACYVKWYLNGLLHGTEVLTCSKKAQTTYSFANLQAERKYSFTAEFYATKQSVSPLAVQSVMSTTAPDRRTLVIAEGQRGGAIYESFVPGGTKVVSCEPRVLQGNILKSGCQIVNNRVKLWAIRDHQSVTTTSSVQAAHLQFEYQLDRPDANSVVVTPVNGLRAAVFREKVPQGTTVSCSSKTVSSYMNQSREQASNRLKSGCQVVKHPTLDGYYVKLWVMVRAKVTDAYVEDFDYTIHAS